MNKNTRDRLLRAVAAVGLLSLGQSAQAATVYWDGNGAAPGAGTAPAGTWGVSSFWNAVADGTGAPGAWTSGNTAVFAAGTTATGVYTVTISGAQTVGGITAEEGEITLTGGGGSLVLSNGGSATIDGSSGFLAVGVPISGDALVKSGGGRLVLRAANTFSGLTMNSGTVTVGHDQALSSGTISVAAGAALEGDVGTHTVANDINVTGSGSLVLRGLIPSSTLNLNGVIGGAGAGLQINSGSIRLNNANTFGGNVSVSGFAELFLGHDQALSSGAVTVSSGTVGGTGSGTRTIANAITINGNFGGTTDTLITGPVSGTSIGKNGSNTVTLTNLSSSFAGNINLGSGTLVLNTAGTSAGTMTFFGGNLAGGASPLNVTKPIVMSSSGAVTGGTVSFSGGISSGSGNLTVSGGTLNLGGGGSWTGGVIINGGTLRTSVVPANTASVTLTNGSLVALGNMAFNGSVPTVVLNGTTANTQIDTQGFTFQIFNTVSGSGALVKSGTGTLQLHKNNTYTGPTVVNAGFLNVTTDGGLGGTANGTLVKSGGRLGFFVSVYPGTYTSAEPVTLEGGSPSSLYADMLINGTFPGPISIQNDAKIQSFSASTLSGNIDNGGHKLRLRAVDVLHVTGVISGAGALVKDDTGTLHLDNVNNSYSGGTIVDGSLGGSSSALSISDGRQLGADTSPLTLNSAKLITTAAVSSPTRPLVMGLATFPGGGTIDTGAFHSSFGPVSGAMALHKFGSGTLTVQNVRIPQLFVNAGNIAIAPSGGQPTGTSKVNSFGLAPGSKLDLADGKLITVGLEVGTWSSGSYTGLTGLIQQGRGDGTWNGTGGVTTSMTTATTSVLTTLAIARADQVGYAVGGAGGTFGGLSVGGSDVLIMYTWGGDADLNGELNGDDYFAIDSHVLQSGSVFGFHNGDFDYDGDIDGDDYFILDSNILQAQGSSPFPTGIGGAGLSAVPEPGVVGAMGLTAIALGSRRRKRRGV